MIYIVLEWHPRKDNGRFAPSVTAHTTKKAYREHLALCRQLYLKAAELEKPYKFHVREVPSVYKQTKGALCKAINEHCEGGIDTTRNLLQKYSSEE